MLALEMTGSPMAKNAKVDIMPSKSWHVGYLKGNLRVEDANEILRFGISVSRGLRISYRHSIIRKTAMIDGSVAAMWGCSGDMLGQSGQPWLLTTPEVHSISPLRFCRIYQEEVYKMLDVFPVLVNYVDAEYSNAIRLLDIIGFEIGEPEPMGENKALYRKFVLRKR